MEQKSPTKPEHPTSHLTIHHANHFAIEHLHAKT